MAVFVCRRCSYEKAEAWEGACPNCGGLYRAKKVGADTDEQKQRSTFASAAKSPYTYIPTGIVGFDRVIGGGLVASQSILLAGFRGAGKSTLLCLVADAVAKLKGGALYASAEEGVTGVMAIAHRLGLRSEKVEVLGNQYSVEKVIEHAERTKPWVTIFDSLQKYSSLEANGAPGSLVQEKAVSTAIRSYCQKTKRCAIVVNQMAKSGEMKGGTDAGHELDTVLILAFPKDDDDEAPHDVKGVRVLLCDGKNRYGDENQKSYWRMQGKDEEQPGMLEEVPARSLLEEMAPRGKYGRRG